MPEVLDIQETDFPEACELLPASASEEEMRQVMRDTEKQTGIEDD